jgi:hypothetical protein
VTLLASAAELTALDACNVVASAVLESAEHTAKTTAPAAPEMAFTMNSSWTAPKAVDHLEHSIDYGIWEIQTGRTEYQ